MNEEITHKRELELEAMRSFKKKMKEKREKAIKELQEFFERSESEKSSDSESNEFLDIILPKSKLEVYTKDGKRGRRHRELQAIKLQTNTSTSSWKAKKCKKKRINFEDYEIKHIIGKGATAVVKLATHKTKKTNIVFKIYEKSQLGKSQMSALRSEISIMKKLDHPHIIKLYDVIEDNEKIMLAMEYLSGGCFRSFLKKRGHKRISEDEAKIYFGQIIDAVKYLHTKGIYHRDLKLDNILLDYKKDIKVIDFGYSVECEPEDLLEIYWGTTPYMAPEMVMKQKYCGQHVDIWSLGVIVYAMLAGQLPFNGKTEEDVIKRIWWGQFRQPTKISYDWKRFLSSILNLDPMKRPSASDLFYDPWNMKYFKTAQKPKRRQFNSSQRSKNLQKMKVLQKGLALTHKRNLHRHFKKLQ